MFGNKTIKKDIDNITIVVDEETEEENNDRSNVNIPFTMDEMSDGTTCLDCWFCSSVPMRNKHRCEIHKIDITDVKIFAYGCANFSTNGN